MICLTSSTAHCWASPHSHWFPFPSRSRSGLVTSPRLGANLPIWFTDSRNLQISPTLVGTGTFRIAATLLRSGLTPDSSITCPKKVTRRWENFRLVLSLPSVACPKLHANTRHALPGSSHVRGRRQSDKLLYPGH